jgi:hypothetical protein
MKVRCVNDDFSNVVKGGVASLVLMVGDDMPVNGKVYEVVGYAMDGSTVKAYELAELDYSNYPGGKLLFKASRFEIIDETFVPNTVCDGYPARALNVYINIQFP